MSIVVQVILGSSLARSRRSTRKVTLQIEDSQSSHFGSALNTRIFGMQERRVLEYVTLGDYQTAVGFLLASTPERSSRFYRDALCTIAMAVRSHLLHYRQLFPFSCF